MSPRETLDNLLRKAEIGALAHAIQLGKCPEPGMIFGFNLTIAEGELDADGKPSVGKSTSEKVPYEFIVTEDLLLKARAAVRVMKYWKDEKLSLMPLKDPE